MTARVEERNTTGKTTTESNKFYCQFWKHSISYVHFNTQWGEVFLRDRSWTHLKLTRYFITLYTNTRNFIHRDKERGLIFSRLKWNLNFIFRFNCIHSTKESLSPSKWSIRQHCVLREVIGVLLYPYGTHKYTAWQNAVSLKVTDKIHIIIAEFRGKSLCQFTLQISDTNVLNKG